MLKNSKGVVDLFLIVVIVLIGLGGLLYYAWQRGEIRKTEQTESPVSNNDEPTPSTWTVYSHEATGLTFSYPENWILSESILMEGSSRKENGKFDLTATDSELYIINLKNKDSYDIEVVLDLEYQQQNLGGYGPIPNNTDNFEEFAIAGRQALRSKFEDGKAMFGGMTPREPYPLSITFRRLAGEGTASWPQPDTDEQIVLLFSAQSPNKRVNYSITYYSPEFTKINVEQQEVSKSTLQEMDQILSTFEFLDNGNGSTGESKTNSSRTITYEKITGWNEFNSGTGYSLQHPPTFTDSDSSGEDLIEGKCSVFFGNNAGGVISASVVPYDGGSRRKLFGENGGMELTYDEAVIQGEQSLLVEIGPLGDSGSGSEAVIPVGNYALVVMWSNRGKDSIDFNNLLKSIRLENSLNLNNCQ